MKIKIISITIFLVAVLMAAGTYFYDKISTERAISQTLSEALERGYSPVYGSEEARVALVEFFDPACGTCAEFSPLVKALVNRYDGKLKLISRYAPLHENSDFVVTLLEATRLQEKFEESLALLFENQNLWVKNHVSQPELAISLLQAADVNIDKVYLDMESDEVLRRVGQDIADMKTLGITQTPSFFVNGRPLVKFGYEELVKLVDSEIKTNYN